MLKSPKRILGMADFARRSEFHQEIMERSFNDSEGQQSDVFVD
jgi:hypothetical protein